MKLRKLAQAPFVPTIIAVGLAIQPVLAATITVNAPDNDGVVIPNGDTLVNNSTITNASGQIAVSGPAGVAAISNAANASITGNNASAIDIANGLGSFINDGGTITAGNAASAAALWVHQGTVTTFVNSGTMSAPRFNVLYFGDGFNNTVANVGTFLNSGNLNGHFDQVVRVRGTTGVFTNTGNITIDDGAGAVFEGMVTTFVNNGNINSSDLGVRMLGGVGTASNTGNITAGMAVNQTAFNVQTQGGTVTNSGTMSGYFGFFAAATATSTTLINTGTIRGAAGGAAITLTDNADNLVLSGLAVVDGITDARAGSDKLTLSGADTGTFALNQIGATGLYRNFEVFEKAGTGTWTFTGDNVAAINWPVGGGGTVIVQGIVPNMNFALTNSTLKGRGTLGTVTVDGTSKVAPGNSVGTLTVASATFAAGSTFEVEIDNTGIDKLVVLGAAQINGGTLKLVPLGGFCNTVNASVLSAAGGVNGTFTTFDNGGLAAASISYDANNVRLTIAGQGRTYAGTGTTANQEQTARALDALGCNNQPYSSQLIALPNGDIPGALQALAGTEHAAIAGSFVESSSIVRNVITDRIDQAFDALESNGALSGYLPFPRLDDIDNKAMWGSVYGGGHFLAGNGNAAATNSSAAGLVVGADGEINEDWRLGMLAGLGVTGINSGNTRGSSTDLTIGGYASAQFGIIDLKVGAAYTRHLIETNRQILFPGVNDTMLARYQAGTLQAFVEASADFDLGAVTLSPFVQLAGVNHHTDAFTETGGAGALSVKASSLNALFLTIGVGIEHQFVLGDTMLVTAKGSAGWRHAVADLPVSQNAFAGGGPFAFSAAPVAQDALVLSAGLSFDVNQKMSFDVTYEGAIGSGLSSHAVKLTLSGKF